MPASLRTIIAGLLVLAAACSTPVAPERTPSATGTTTTPGEPMPSVLPPDDPLAKIACGLPRSWVVRIARGYRRDRSAELQIVPKPDNYVGAGLPHVGPYPFTSEVPMLFYGPGFIKPLGVVNQSATTADLAPTWARLLDFDGFEAPDGRALTDVLVPAEEREDPPKLLVTLILDGTGRNVLREWPNDWPNLKRLRSEGAWIEHAEVGSSPTSSAQIHATIGTGAFPRTHGLVGHSLRIDGKIVSPWKEGPTMFLTPTLADVYDRAMDNRPLAGMLGTVAIQIGMLGQGAHFEGGDRDLVVLREAKDAETLGAEGVAWNLTEQFRQWYSFPGYANDLPALASYFPQYDRLDGEVDGAWRGHPLDEEIIQGGFQTPARVPYQTRLVREVLEREGFGADDTPDLLYINYKLIDQLGHIFSMNNLEVKDALAASDAHIPVLIRALNRTVGRGEWAMVITADHGSTPSPEVTQGFQISAERLHGSIQERFDRDDDDVPVVEQVKQTEIFIDTAELEEHGGTLAEVARFVQNLRQEELVIPDVSIVTDPRERVFRAAFPSDILPHLPCLPSRLQGAPSA